MQEEKKRDSQLAENKELKNFRGEKEFNGLFTEKMAKLSITNNDAIENPLDFYAFSA